MSVKVTLWDARASERRGCISRMTPGGSDLPLNAVTADPTGTFIGIHLASVLLLEGKAMCNLT